jgi:hypothetical protein
MSTKTSPFAKVPKRLFKVGAYAFCAPDSVEGTSRDFTVEVYSDRTCSWLDETGRLLFRHDPYLELEACAPLSTAEIELRDEETAFRYDGAISEAAFRLVVEKEAHEASGGEISREMCAVLDSALAADFWRINERLRIPLTPASKAKKIKV